MNEKELRALKMINEIEQLGGKINLMRAEKMRQYFNNRLNDAGYYGRICELYDHTLNSRVVKVALQGKDDTHFKVLVGDKIKYIAAERKTGGGRIESLYKKSAPKFVIYSFIVQNKLVKEPRILEPILIPTSLFLQVLEECNAVKNSNGRNPERAIQVTSKKMFERFLEYPIPFDRNETYTLADFEEIEIW